MKASVIVKSILASMFTTMGGISWKLRRISSSNFLILMYHRVIPGEETGEIVQPGMYVEPDALEDHVKFLQPYFNVTPMSGLQPILKRDFMSKKNEKPPCFLTFDDGWHDFYTHAFPILKKCQLPATVFLPIRYIGTRDRFWTDRLSYLLSHRKSINSPRTTNSSLNPLVNKLEKIDGSREAQLEEGIKMLKPYREDEIEDVLQELSTRWHLNPKPLERGFLTWDEIREMADSELISFGSHTVAHRILTLLQQEEIEEELRTSRDRLIEERVVDPAFIPFSYPNGEYTKKIASLVKASGYSMAVTTENGWNAPETDLFALKRVSIHQDIASTKPMFSCKILGIF